LARDNAVSEWRRLLGSSNNIGAEGAEAKEEENEPATTQDEENEATEPKELRQVNDRKMPKLLTAFLSLQLS